MHWKLILSFKDIITGLEDDAIWTNQSQKPIWGPRWRSGGASTSCCLVGGHAICGPIGTASARQACVRGRQLLASRISSRMLHAGALPSYDTAISAARSARLRLDPRTR